ncbi:hypothetical protein ACFFIF_01960 [Vagococcus entomophilus]|uniref:DUF3168 domain-containing protein n=1 Tax=Vagococcus entomophilus TaxID=1160095 RepID=A0A430AK99_9ENTE|nr:hypothetical protein [Vagococcus entomophilus]RSU08433.1 hypothetical protein CBF30_04120 [Vagococcus entomophilus]
MKDKLSEVYDSLIRNEYISSTTKITESDEYRIKFYEYPSTGDKAGPMITIRPLKAQNDAYHGSDKELSIQFWYQIDVEGTYRTTIKQIQSEIKKEMKKMGFAQSDGGLDEYFSDTKRYVDARRYTGNTTIYDTEY